MVYMVPVDDKLRGSEREEVGLRFFWVISSSSTHRSFIGESPCVWDRLMYF